MTEERITETRTPSGDTHTTHTVFTDDRGRPGGGAKWGLLLLVALAAVAAFLIFSQMSGAEVAKDNAVADAANSVGAAAENVSDAVTE